MEAFSLGIKPPPPPPHYPIKIFEWGACILWLVSMMWCLIRIGTPRLLSSYMSPIKIYVCKASCEIMGRWICYVSGVLFGSKMETILRTKLTGCWLDRRSSVLSSHPTLYLWPTQLTMALFFWCMWLDDDDDTVSGCHTPWLNSIVLRSLKKFNFMGTILLTV